MTWARLPQGLQTMEQRSSQDVSADVETVNQPPEQDSLTQQSEVTEVFRRG